VTVQRPLLWLLGIGVLVMTWMGTSVITYSMGYDAAKDSWLVIHEFDGDRFQECISILDSSVRMTVRCKEEEGAMHDVMKSWKRGRR
jgi:hypothetical protein